MWAFTRIQLLVLMLCDLVITTRIKMGNAKLHACKNFTLVEAVCFLPQCAKLYCFDLKNHLSTVDTTSSCCQ